MRSAQAIERSTRFLSLIICIGLLALTWFVFGQTLRFDFVNYDDPEWVSQNPHVVAGLTKDGVIWAVQRWQAGPLASISHMVDVAIFGLNPAGHHFTNVVLHSLAVVLLFLVWQRMTRQLWASAFVAALFAIHPLRVESVAWVTERKDVLSGVFFALTLGAYLAYVRKPSLGRYLVIVVAFVFGLLTKGTLVALPVLLLLLDYWPLGRAGSSPRRVRPTANREQGARSGEVGSHRTDLQRPTWGKLIVEKIPLFVLAAIAAGLTFLGHSAGLGSVQAVPFALRLANAPPSCVIYLRQMFAPVGLTAFYGYNEHLSVVAVLFSAVFLVAVSVAAVLWRKRLPYFFTGWFWYLALILPVSGLIQAGSQAHADRYTYLSQIGLYIVLVWGIGDLSARWLHRSRILSVAAVVVIIGLALTARQATAYWRDSESLWRRTITVNPTNDFAHANLADLFLRDGRATESISESEAALQFNPRNADAHNNLALAISRAGRLREAIDHWKTSLEIQPANLNARCNLAWVLATAPDPSVRDGPQAVALVEQVARGTGNSNIAVLQILGAAYAESGRFPEAIEVTRQASEMAARQGHQSWADSLRRNIASYENGQPFRDSTLTETNAVPPTLARPR